MERIQSTLTILTIAVNVMESCGITDEEVTTTSVDKYGIRLMVDKGPKSFDFINKLTAKLELTLTDTHAHSDDMRYTEFFTNYFKTPAGRSVDICLVKESK